MPSQHQVMKSNQKLLKSLCKAAPKKKKKKKINQSINYHERDILEQDQRRRHTNVPTQFILI